MARAFIFLSLASVLVAAAALISVLSVEDKSKIRGIPRFAWVFLIVLAPLLGSIAYFVAGRPRREDGSGTGWLSAPPRPTAPDDDPDFLRSLEERTSQSPDEDEMLRRWEEEMRHGEDEQRRRDQGNDG